MSTQLSRRAVAQGAAWSVPAVVLSTAAPALAASQSVAITTPSPLPVGYVNESYTQQLSATIPVGVAPRGQAMAADAPASTPTGYTWSAQDLPLGIQLSHDGVLMGAPARAAEHPVTVTISNGSAEDTATLLLPVDHDRTVVTTEMLRLVNAHRAGIGLPALERTATMDQNITDWTEHLAQEGAGLKHQDSGVTGYAENLSATCSAPGSLGFETPEQLAFQLVDGWLSEPHSYEEYVALQATDPAAAADMYYGRGAYSRASGHRINIENPVYELIGLGYATSVSGSACTVQDPRWSVGRYGGIVLRWA